MTRENSKPNDSEQTLSLSTKQKAKNNYTQVAQ